MAADCSPREAATNGTVLKKQKTKKNLPEHSDDAHLTQRRVFSHLWVTVSVPNLLMGCLFHSPFSSICLHQPLQLIIHLVQDAADDFDRTRGPAWLLKEINNTGTSNFYSLRCFNRLFRICPLAKSLQGWHFKNETGTSVIIWSHTFGLSRSLNRSRF